MATETVADIAKVIVATLEEPEVKVVDFWLGALHVDWKGLRRVGQALKSGRVRVVLDANAVAWAEYKPGKDNLIVKPSPEWDSLESKGLFVHEAVHALIDMVKGTKTTQLSEEVAAYLAQVLYLVKKSPAKRTSFQSQESGDDRIFKWAIDLVDAHKMMTGSTRLHYNDYKDFRTKIHKTNLYKDVGLKAVKVHDGFTHLGVLRGGQTSAPVRQRLQ